jgi:hypothetical protein
MEVAGSAQSSGIYCIHHIKDKILFLLQHLKGEVLGGSVT